jgi:subtilisin family serine protease
MAARSKPADGSGSAERSENPVVGPRERTFLIARQETPIPFGVPPIDIEALLDQLGADPAVTVERVLTAEGLTASASIPSALQKIIVARMPEDRARALAGHPQVLIEADAAIHPLPATLPPVPADAADPAAFLPFGPPTTWRFRVLGEDDTPVAGAAVFVFGSGMPAQGRTDATGAVAITLFNTSDDAVGALYVNPPSDHWDLWVDEPKVDSATLNVVRLEPLGRTTADPPEAGLIGWGRRAMRLDRLDAALTGAGVRIGLIDSGAAPTHPDLTRIATGRNFTVAPPADTGWDDDVLGHGSHCSGIIAGTGDAGGLRGFAPDAEILELRVFPGGRFSTLLAALDHCIEAQVDVVDISLGSAAASALVLGKLAQAKAAGVACVVAAGNTGGPVRFPGTSPDVLTVAAVGRVGEFPLTSRHARQIPAYVDVVSGYFSARFSSHGPEVDVCAPGVAVVSSVPPAGYAAWDGTSAAASHVTGLAALVLAHHQDFTDRFAARDGARVDHLFEILRASATPLDFGDAGRSGAGMPDAVRALSRGLVSSRPGVNAPQTGSPWAVIEQLRREFVAAGLVPA